MRLDRYLHCIRLVKSRSLALSLIDTGHVRVNRRPVTRASEPVRPGDVIALPLHHAVRVIEVVTLPTRRGPPAEARAAYREIDESASPT